MSDPVPYHVRDTLRGIRGLSGIPTPLSSEVPRTKIHNNRTTGNGRISSDRSSIRSFILLLAP